MRSLAYVVLICCVIAAGCLVAGADTAPALGEFLYSETQRPPGSGLARAANVLADVVAPAAATADFTVLAEWGSGMQVGLFREPEDIVVDPIGNVYICDTYNGRVQKHDPVSQLWSVLLAPVSSDARLGPSAAGLWVVDTNQPTREYSPDGAILRSIPISRVVATASDDVGNTYVADEALNRIIKFGPDGRYVREWNSDSGYSGLAPYDIAVDAAGNVFVADVPGYGDFRVRRLAPGATEFAEILQSSDFRLFLACHAGKLWVTSESNGPPPAEYEPDGTLLRRWPGGVRIGPATTDDASNTYLADSASRRVVRFDQSGRYAGEWRWHSERLLYPVGLVADENANIYVSGGDGGGGHSWIDRMSAGTGQFESLIELSDDPCELAIQEGSLWACSSSGSVYRYGLDGTLQATWRSRGIAAIVADGAGNTYLTDSTNDCVVKLDPTGRYLGEWGQSHLSDPRDIAVDGDGNIYVADQGDARIEKFSAVGTHVGGWAAPAGTLALAAHEDSIWVADGSGGIRQFNPDGSQVSSFAGGAWGSYLRPGGLAVAPSGELHVADAGQDVIHRYAADGTHLGDYGGADGLSLAGSVTVAPDGTVWADENPPVISGVWLRKYAASDLSFIGRLGDMGSTATPFISGRSSNSFKDVDVGPDGALRVVCDGAHGTQVQEFGAGDAYTGCHWIGPDRPAYANAIGLDSAGNLHFAMGVKGGGGVRVCDRHGNLLRSYGDAGEGAVYHAVDAVVDADDNCWVYDRAHSDISQYWLRRFGPDGSYLGKWGDAGAADTPFGATGALSLSPDGNVQVLAGSSGLSETQVFERDGTLIGQWWAGHSSITRGGRGFDLDSSGNLHFVGTDHVEVIDEHGNYLRQYGNLADDSGFRGFRGGISIDASDAAWLGIVDEDVVNVATQWLGKFAPDGSYVGRWGRDGSSQTPFRNLNHVDVADDGVVRVLENRQVDWSNRVACFDGNGGYLNQWWAGATSLSRGMRGLEVDAAGHLHVCNGSAVGVFDEHDNQLRVYGDSGPGRLQNAHDVAIDGNGTTWVAVRPTSGGYWIQRFAPDGSYLGQIGDGGSTVVPFGQLGALSGGVDGNMWVSTGSALQVFAPDGSLLETWAVETLYAGATAAPSAPTLDGAAMSPDGMLYAVDGANNRVVKLTRRHLVSIARGPFGSPNPAGPGETVQCSASALCTRGHSLTYQWTAVDSDGVAAGSFSDATAADPVWTPPPFSETGEAAYTIGLTVTCTDTPELTVTAEFTQVVRSPLANLALNKLHNGVLATGQQVDLYQLDVASAGQRLWVHLDKPEATWPSLTASRYVGDVDGAALRHDRDARAALAAEVLQADDSITAASVEEQLLTIGSSQVGTYYIVVTGGRNSEGGTYTIAARDAWPVICVGDPVDGQIAVGGQVARYQKALAANELVWLRLTKPSGNWSSSVGTRVGELPGDSGGDWASSTTEQLVEIGGAEAATYYIAIQGSDFWSRGQYRLELVDEWPSLTLETPHDGELALVGQVDRYQIDIPAGESIWVQLEELGDDWDPLLQASAGGLPQQSGDVVSSERGLLSLSAGVGGRHHITVEGTGSEAPTGQYRLLVTSSFPGESVPAGEQVQGSIAHIGQVDLYSFDLAAGEDAWLHVEKPDGAWDSYLGVGFQGLPVGAAALAAIRGTSALRPLELHPEDAEMAPIDINPPDGYCPTCPGANTAEVVGEDGTMWEQSTRDHLFHVVAANSGTYYVALRADIGLSGSAAYTLSVSDDFPGSTIEVGGALNGRLTRSGQVDWYQCTPAAGQHVGVQVQKSGREWETWLGVEEGGVPDEGSPLVHESRYDQILDMTATGQAPCYIRVHSDQTGSYRLAASDTLPTTALQLNAPHQGTISARGQTDWFEIDLPAGATPYIHLSRGTPDGQATVAGDFGKLPIIDPLVSGTGARDQLIPLAAAQAGTYFIAVRGHEMSACGAYQVTVTDTQPPTELSLNETVSGQIGGTQEIDWYKVHLSAGQPAYVHVEKSSGYWGAKVTLTQGQVGAAGAAVTSHTSRADHLLTIANAQDGPYYVAVGSHWAETGAYEITVLDAIPTTQLTLDQPGSGQIADSSQVDIFSIDLPALDEVFVHVTKPNGAWNSTLKANYGALPDGGGTLRCSSAKDQLLRFGDTEAGTLYVTVSGAPPGEYDLTVTAAFPGREAVKETPLDGDLARTAQVDWYRLDLPAAGSTYMFIEKPSGDWRSNAVLEAAYPPCGQGLISTSATGDDLLPIRSESGGSYYIGIDGETTGPYRCTVTDDPPTQELALGTDARIEPGSAFSRIYEVQVPDAERLFITFQEVLHGGYPTHHRGTVTLSKDGQVIQTERTGGGSSVGDFITVAKDVAAGTYLLEVSYPGEAIIWASTQLPELTLDELYIGHIISQEGLDWVQLEIPEGLGSVDFELTAILGMWSTIDVWKDDYGTEHTWHRYRGGEHNLELSIPEPEAGTYYVQVHDSGNRVGGGTQERDYTIIATAGAAPPPPLEIADADVSLTVDRERATITNLTFKHGSNANLIDDAEGRGLLDFGSVTDRRIADVLKDGWEVQSENVQTGYAQLEFRHPNGFTRRLSLAWSHQGVDVRMEHTCPQAVVTDNNVVPGGTIGGVDHWAVPAAEGTDEGTFNYGLSNAQLYPATPGTFGQPAGGWLALWDDAVGETCGFTFSDGHLVQIGNDDTTHVRLEMPAGDSSVAFHVRPSAGDPTGPISDLTDMPELQLACTADHRFAAAGSEVTYTLSCANTGTSDASGTQVVARLPADGTYAAGSATEDGVHDAGAGTVTWDLGILPQAADLVEVQFRIQVNDGVADGTDVVVHSEATALAHPIPVAADATVTVGQVPVIDGMTPSGGGNVGMCTVMLGGQGFDINGGAVLRRVGESDVQAEFIGATDNGTQGEAVFDLTGCKSGQWELVWRSSDGAESTPHPFEVQSGGGAELDVEIIGPETIRQGRPFMFQVRVRNIGNTDAICPYVIVRVPRDAQLELLTPVDDGQSGGIAEQLGPVRSTEVESAGVADTVDVLGIYKANIMYFPNLPSNGMSDTILTYSLYCNRDLAPGEAAALATASQTLTDGRAGHETDWSLIRAHIDWMFNKCMEKQLKLWLGLVVLRKSQRRVKCYWEWMKFAYYVGRYRDDTKWEGKKQYKIENPSWDPEECVFYIPPENRPKPMTAQRVWKQLLKAQLVCTIGNDRALRKYVLPVKYLADSPEIWEPYIEAKLRELEKVNAAIYLPDAVTSTTPEDKWGPMGYDPPETSPCERRHYVSGDEPFEYRIDYWNKEDATAPAQDVFIDDQLDPNFDLSTFEFGDFGFLKWTVQVEPGQQEIDEIVDLRPDMELLVHLHAWLDEDGEVHWVFNSLDPYTNRWPEDPFAGYLPPMTESGYELGWVTYTVQPKADLPTGTEIRNQCFVNFDGVGPWNPAPKNPDSDPAGCGPWLNTIDAGAPSSQVDPFDGPVAESFVVSWAGQDDENGSGVGAYDIYVSHNDGPFELWLKKTSDTSAQYTGQMTHTYAFYSVAHDNVGNVEDPPVDQIPDATATVGLAENTAAFRAGVSMVSLPVAPTNTDPASLGFQADRWARWDPFTQQYVYYNNDAGHYTWFDPPGEAVGKGYWACFEQDAQVAIAGAAVDDGAEYVVSVDPGPNGGWVQIGCPRRSAVPWITDGEGCIKVRWQGQEMSLHNAARMFEQSEGSGSYRTICSDYAWGYERERGYFFVVDPQFEEWPNWCDHLSPWAGYWLRVFEPCELVFPTVAASTAAARDRTPVKRSQSGWTMLLQANAATGAKSQALVGKSDTGTQMAAPPPFMEFVHLTVIDGDDRLGVDLRDAKETSAWTLELSTDLSQTDITLTWPDLSRLPNSYRPVLTDVKTGTRRYMRTSSSHVFTSAAGGETRRFTLEMAPPDDYAMAVAAVTAAQTAGGQVDIRVNLTGDASLDVEVLNIAGRKVGDVCTAQECEKGITTLTYNGAGSRGTRLPNGRYLIRVRARTEDGQQAHAITTFQMVR